MKQKNLVQRPASFWAIGTTIGHRSKFGGMDGPPPPMSTSQASIEKAIQQTYVPAVLNIFMDVVYAPIPAEYRRHFNLDKFKSGEYINKKGFKGFI